MEEVRAEQICEFSGNRFFKELNGLFVLPYLFNYSSVLNLFAVK